MMTRPTWSLKHACHGEETSVAASNQKALDNVKKERLHQDNLNVNVCDPMRRQDESLQQSDRMDQSDTNRSDVSIDLLAVQTVSLSHTQETQSADL